MKIICCVQARLSSTRLPFKVMRKIMGRPMIHFLIERVLLSKKIDQVVIVTGMKEKNKPLLEYFKDKNVPVYFGDENNVLKRFYEAAKKFNADAIVRVTGDCPLIDYRVVDDVISKFIDSNVDYCSNINPPTFPDGLDVEVFSMNALTKTFQSKTNNYENEHVTPFIRNSKLFKKANVEYKTDLSKKRWTVDYSEDFDLVKKIFTHFKGNINFNLKDILEFEAKNLDLLYTSKKYLRNEGMKKSSGQKLWNRAKNVVAGGNMLLSKRPEMFLPNKWPAYFSKTKGVHVWDLDGNKFTDMSIMGVGTNSLGYSNKYVDNAVKDCIKNGNLSTLNAPEEVFLAEKLIELHSWADMVRFARSGGEANAIAIRIARASAGKDNVAICGYHGWHDWYLSANINNVDGLKEHLLPGLSPLGVPRNLKDTVFPFKYNNFSELQKIISEHDIGVVKMEVVRSELPKDDFLIKVRKLCDEKNIVLVFDECTSGFRESFGGIHLNYKVYPDIAMFGKALGNGYAITSIIGKRSVMESAQNTFISSTFWTERIGSCAAIATLNEMENLTSWNTITKLGCYLKQEWEKLAKKYNLDLKQYGIPALAGFSFNSHQNLQYKTFITQEMLKHNFLAANSVYMSTCHSKKIIDEYINILDSIFHKISDCEHNSLSINSLLENPICQDGFKRLN